MDGSFQSRRALDCFLYCLKLYNFIKQKIYIINHFIMSKDQEVDNYRRFLIFPLYPNF